MSKLVLSGDTSGSVTLDAPAVSGTTTLTLPTTSGTVVTDSATQTLTNKTLTSPTLTTPALGTPASGNLVNCTGVANTAKAWVRWSGGASPSISSSFNVSSVTRSSAGVFTVNFTNAMADTLFAAVGSTSLNGTPNDGYMVVQTFATGSVQVVSRGSGALVDAANASVVVFR
jgi:hypothetical protein